MHEMSIMDNALKLALNEAAQAGAQRVHLIQLRVGTLSGVVPEALEMAFAALTPGTMAQGAELAIESVAAAFWCPHCQSEFAAQDLGAECPECHQFSWELKAGRELELASMEIE